MASDGIKIPINVEGDVIIIIKELRAEFEAFKKQVVNIAGETTEGFNKVNKSISDTTREVSRATDGMRVFILQAGRELYKALEQPFRDGARAMYDYDTMLRDVVGITKATAQEQALISKYARQSAKTFGGTATDQLRTYQLILAELSPDLVKTPDALAEMGKSVNTLAQTMGGDSVGAAKALNAAMNQFGVDISNPMQAAEEMRIIMNQMGAASQAGSVDVTDIAEALNNVGSAAKAAGLNSSETMAALEVLGKAGRKGAEGGIALRNVLRIIGRDEFMTSEVAKRMELYGVNLKMLADPAERFRDKLVELQKIGHDGTLMSGLFGANEIAGRALIQNIDLFDDYNEKITENTTATEEWAAKNLDSLANQKARITAMFDDLKLSIMGAFGGALPYIEGALSAVGGFINLLPGLQALKMLLHGTALGMKLQALWTKILIPLTSGWAVVTNALGVAFRFMMGPVGWIITGIGLVAAGVVYAWNKFEGFRAAIFGIWEAVKKVFSNIAKFIGDMMQPFFDAVSFISKGEWKKAAVALGKGLIKISMAPLSFITKTVTGELFEGVGDAYSEGDAKGRASFKADQDKKKQPTEVEAPELEKLMKQDRQNAPLLGNLETPQKLSPGSGSGSGTGGGSGRVVTTRIEQLVGALNVYVQGGIVDFENKVRDAVNSALIGAVRDSEIALS